MKITFKLLDKQVAIMNGDKEIGRIFSPSGTSRDKPNAIQVCGFSQAFEYWGCGRYGDGKGNPKRDIQLLFEEDSQMESLQSKRIITNDYCQRCFYPIDICMCKDLVAKPRIKNCEEDIKKNKEKLLRLKIVENLDGLK